MPVHRRQDANASSAAHLGPAPETYSVHDKALTGKMTAADLARVRAEIFGEEPPSSVDEREAKRKAEAEEWARLEEEVAQIEAEEARREAAAAAAACDVEVEEIELAEADLEMEPVASPSPPASMTDPLGAIRRRIAEHDFGGAILLSEAVLADDPENASAKRYLEACRSTLANIYLTHLGGGAEIPRIVMSSEQLRCMNLDRWGAFVMSRVDGESSIDDIIDIAGMPRLDALRILYELLQQGVIGPS